MAETDGLGASVATEMAEKMRIKEGDDERTVLSKKLSYVLRHGAKLLDLEVDDSGYVCVNDLLACDELFKGVAFEALLEVVKLSNVDKQRYEISEQDGDFFIRATGKHTMQGLARAEAKKKPKRLSREGGANTSGAGGDRQRPARQITEEEFSARWRLDRLARVRLAELPAASRQLAMQQFSPGPQVPSSDFPKVFVAFCKRFRQKGKDDGAGVDMDDDYELEDSLASAQPRASAARSRGKKKSGRGRDSDQAPTGGGTGGSRGNASRIESNSSTSGTQPPSKEVVGLSFIEVGAGRMNPYYPSPGSTPRSDGSPERGLLLHTIGVPLSPAAASSHPPNSPPTTLPPPRASPPPAVRMMAPQPPPPPTHAPQVPGFSGFQMEGGGSPAHGDRGGYQDASMQAHASQWGLRGAQADLRIQRNSAPAPPQSPPAGPHSVSHSAMTSLAGQQSGMPAPRAMGGYQDMAVRGYDGAFNRDSDYRLYDSPDMYHRQQAMHGYQDSHPSHPVGRAQMSPPQGYFAPFGYRSVVSEPSPTVGNEVYRGVAVGHAWTPSADEYGACY